MSFFFVSDSTEDPKDLIRKCLVVDPEKRINVRDALKHPFFNTVVSTMIYSGMTEHSYEYNLILFWFLTTNEKECKKKDFTKQTVLIPPQTLSFVFIYNFYNILFSNHNNYNKTTSNFMFSCWFLNWVI